MMAGLNLNFWNSFLACFYAMILGPAFRTQKQVGDAGVLPTNPLQKERMRPLPIRWCWTLLELLQQALSPNNVALAYRQLFFHSAAAPQASSIASLPPCGKVTLWAATACNATPAQSKALALGRLGSNAFSWWQTHPPCMQQSFLTLDDLAFGA